MIKAESRGKIRGAKKRIRSQMKNYKILVKDVADRSEYHEQTVKDALNPELAYWNESVSMLAQEMINEKKEALTSNN